MTEPSYFQQLIAKIHTIPEKSLDWKKATRWGTLVHEDDSFTVHDWNGKLYIRDKEVK